MNVGKVATRLAAVAVKQKRRSVLMHFRLIFNLKVNLTMWLALTWPSSLDPEFWLERKTIQVNLQTALWRPMALERGLISCFYTQQIAGLTLIYGFQLKSCDSPLMTHKLWVTAIRKQFKPINTSRRSDSSKNWALSSVVMLPTSDLPIIKVFTKTLESRPKLICLNYLSADVLADCPALDPQPL